MKPHILILGSSGFIGGAVTAYLQRIHAGEIQSLSSRMLDLTEEEWERTIHINLKGQFLCAQRAAKEMAKNEWGRLINIASIASGGLGLGFSNSVHYVSSKGGIPE